MGRTTGMTIYHNAREGEFCTRDGTPVPVGTLMVSPPDKPKRVSTIDAQPTFSTLSNSKSESQKSFEPVPETGEATDEILEGNVARHVGQIGELCDRWKFEEAHSLLSHLLKRAREMGENRVCARLPRLWGFWESGRWAYNIDGIILGTKAIDLRPVLSKEAREYDPRTGGPKP